MVSRWPSLSGAMAQAYRRLLGDNMECKVKGLAQKLGQFSKAGPRVVLKKKLFGIKSLVENHIGMMVKKPRTYNGLELYNWEFELCTQSGIAVGMLHH
ncbi:hypothetical protein Tco_1540034 [Tanacetum coccineum]